MQLLLGALLVGGIALWFITRALQGYTANPPWLIVAIPCGATLLWIVGATVALHLAIQQRGHADTSDANSPTEPAQAGGEMSTQALSQNPRQRRR